MFNGKIRAPGETPQATMPLHFSRLQTSWDPFRIFILDETLMVGQLATDIHYGQSDVAFDGAGTQPQLCFGFTPTQHWSSSNSKLTLFFNQVLIPFWLILHKVLVWICTSFALVLLWFLTSLFSLTLYCSWKHLEPETALDESVFVLHLLRTVSTAVVILLCFDYALAVHW